MAILRSYDSQPLYERKMAVKMSLFWISLVLSVIGSNAAGELSILYSPDSLKFSGNSAALESQLKEIVSASLGLSVEESSEWNGLTISDPFNTPEAVVEVYIDGVSSLGNVGLKSKNFPLTVDEYEPDTFDAVSHRIRQRFTNGGNNIVNIKLTEPNDLSANSDVLGPITPPKVPKRTLQYLKNDVEEDYEFLAELEILNAITAKVSSGAVSSDNVVDLYNFRFRSLHALSDLHGPQAPATKEAKQLLAESLSALSAAFQRAYDGSVLVLAVASDVAHTRRAVRSVNTRLQAHSAADAYSADYAAIFNIILWFGVVFVFTMVSIVYALVDMDPGRDSIIYRMTSARIKKDN